MATVWTRKRTRAALAVAEDVLTDVQIAAQAGVNKDTLETWKRRPDFRERVDEHVRSFAEEIKAQGIANRQNRVDALNDRWAKIRQVVDERGGDPAMATVPGGKTGLLVHQRKQLGAGPHAQIIDEYALDTGLLSELRQHEQQAAKELGQWADRAEVSGRDGGPIQQAIDHSGAVEVRVVDYRQTAAALQPEAGAEMT